MEKLPGWAKDDFRQPGLHNAVNAGQVEIARYFLGQGAKLDGNSVLRVAQSESNSSKSLNYLWNMDGI